MSYSKGGEPKAPAFKSPPIGKAKGVVPKEKAPTPSLHDEPHPNDIPKGVAVPKPVVKAPPPTLEDDEDTPPPPQHPNQQHYNTLGLNSNATNAEITRAYRKLALIHHPDKPTGNVQKFQEINNAYHALMGEGLRKRKYRRRNL